MSAIRAREAGRDEMRILARADVVERARDRHAEPAVRLHAEHFLRQLAESVRARRQERMLLGERLRRPQHRRAAELGTEHASPDRPDRSSARST